SGLYHQDRDLVGYGRNPPRVSWPEGARLALTLVVAYEEGSEYSFAAGDGRSEPNAEVAYPKDAADYDYTTESGYQDRSPAGIWRLQRLLDEYRLRATFLGCAVAYELNPEVGRYVAEAGHEPACHGWRWENVYTLSREEEREHLRAAVESIERTCGERPRGWYS